MSNMFQGCSQLKEINLKNFDTSKVQKMARMFGSCISLTSLAKAPTLIKKNANRIPITITHKTRIKGVTNVSISFVSFLEKDLWTRLHD